jgi:Tfp pilus assembly protein PilX
MVDMTAIESPRCDADRARERGSALILALILTIVLTFLGFGLITRSLLVTRIAGSERWSTKAFYAADAGIAVARARLSINVTPAFNFQVTDFRGPLGNRNSGAINVWVSDMNQVGAPQLAVGWQAPGGQGAESEPMYITFYKGTSIARQNFTRSERIVSATLTVGPAPLPPPQ